MRRNTKKLKPNPGSISRHSIRSSSIRDIIGDRRFNGQFSHVNTHGTEGTKKVKTVKSGDAEADDLPNLGQNASSSSQCETAEDPRRSCGDFAAKTSEFAFFKQLKKTTSNNTRVHPKYHDNQLNNVQHTDHSTIEEEIPNVQKESIKYSRPSLPVENEQDDSHYTFLTPVYRSKTSVENKDTNTNAQKVTPGENNWLTPSVHKKTNTSGVFPMKRKKLRHMVADKSQYDINELSSNGVDLVSVLMSRILPKDHENNCEEESNSKNKPPSFSSSEAFTLTKNTESNKRKPIKSNHTSFMDDDFPTSSERHKDINLLEWNPNKLESSLIVHPPKSSIQYNHYHSEAYQRKLIKSQHMSYFDDDDIPKSSDRFTDMELLEWNPDYFESSEHCYSEAYKRKWGQSDCFPRLLEWNPTFPESNHCLTEDGFRIPNLAIDKEIEEFHFDNENKVLEFPRPLLLEWEDRSVIKDDFQTTFSTSSSTLKDNDYDVFLPKASPLTPCIDNHFVTSSLVPYTPKHESFFNKKEESFVFMYESMDEKERDLKWGPDNLLEGEVKRYNHMEAYNDGEDFHHPLLLGDSSWNKS